MATALLCAVAVMVITSSPEQLHQGTYPNRWSWEQSQSLNQLTHGEKTIALGICTALGLAGLALLGAELMPSRRRPRHLLIRLSDTGAATIDTQSIEALIATTALSNARVTSVSCNVHHSGTNTPHGPDRLAIRCTPTLKMGANVVEITQDLQSRIKVMVESSTGLEVQAVNVIRTKFQKLPKGHLLEEPDRTAR